MSDTTPTVRRLQRQQAALADFGGYALRQGDLLSVLDEAARVCAECLDVPFSKVCRYRPEENDLLIVAGHGWKPGVIGNVISRADASSPQGRAFVSGEPSICNDLRSETDFELPAFYAEHHVVSTIDVVIKGEERPFGVLEIDNDAPHDYDDHDIDFLTGFANVLAEAVATAVRNDLLRATVDRMAEEVEEKERLLDQKKVLAEELQHRVRNNLQLVYGMLMKQLKDTRDDAGKRGLLAIARRVSTLAQVYDHLLGNEMTRTTDFGSYVTSLCFNLAEIQTTPTDGVTLTCDSDPLLLELDMVTALGLIVTELVANCYDHAFPEGTGTIAVTVRRPAGDTGIAVLTITDSGRGFASSPESKRHGLGLVRRLIEQVRGTARRGFDHGSVWTIRFPVAPIAA